MTEELILSEEQMNEMAEQLFERMNETILPERQIEVGLR